MRLASLLGPDLKLILKEDPEQVRELLDAAKRQLLPRLLGL